MPESFDSLLRDTVGCARDMWLNGWAENGAGNLSVRMDPEMIKGVEGRSEGSGWFDTGGKAPRLGGAAFLMSARGSLFRRLHDRPSEGCGVIRLDDGGERYRIVWGFEREGAPSSEIQSHMAVQAVGARSDTSAVVHVHAPNIIALACSMTADTVSLTRLLWSLHSECIALFPEGIEVAPWCLPGSAALSAATARGFLKRRLMVWPFHGVVAAGRSLDEAMGLIEIVEKVSEIYLKAATAGGPNAWLTEEDLRAAAEHFGVAPDEDILCSPYPRIETVGGRKRTKRSAR